MKFVSIMLSILLVLGNVVFGNINIDTSTVKDNELSYIELDYDSSLDYALNAEFEESYISLDSEKTHFFAK